MSETLSSPATVRAILQSLDLRPSKVLGQNFLVDGNTLDILVRAADLAATDRVIEIGPGLGVVTRALLDRVAAVIAIEKDARLCGYLRESLANRPTLELHCSDALDMDLAALVSRGFTVLVANLPYVAGSRILVEFATAPVPPDRMVVTVQREVADRLCALPATPGYGLLSLWVQLHYRAELIRTVPPTCFWPRPGVRSAIVKMVRRTDLPPLSPDDADLLRAVSRYAFMHRRKQLAKLLSQAVAAPARPPEAWQEILSACGLDRLVRPEGLAPEDWRRLVNDALHGCRLTS